MHISALSPMVAPQLDTVAPSSPSGSPFRDVLSSAIDRVELSGHNATVSVHRFLSGEGDDLHSTVLAVQRADLEFQMAMQVRNKVVSAYQEIMRMQM
jgi:flagellar hook-basal body complex protein FliE